MKPEQFRKLVEAIRSAYREMCERGECSCVTFEEHEKNLAGREVVYLERNNSVFVRVAGE